MEGNETKLPMETEGISAERSSISHQCFVCTSELAENSTESQSGSFAFESFCKLFHVPENLVAVGIQQSEHKFCNKCLDLIAVAEGKVQEIELLENNLLAIKEELKDGILLASTSQSSPSENKDRWVLVNWLNGTEGRITVGDTEWRQGGLKMDSRTYEEISSGTASRQHHEKSANNVEVIANESSGSFQCSFCPRSFQSERARMAHARVHSRGQPLSCPLCNVFCTSLQKFKGHFSRYHSDKTSTVCSGCKIDLKSGQVATSVPPEQTSSCKDEVALAKLHAEHAPNCTKDPKSETNEGAYECRKCNFRCKRKAQLTRHELSSHEKGADNEEDAEEGKNNDDDYTDNVEFSAENCSDSAFKTPAETPFKCFYCPKSFATENARNGHGKIHGDRKPFRCQLCNVGFGTLTKFKIHLSQKHRDASSEKICPLCNSHLTTQTEGGQYQCPTDGCRDAFQSITKLRAHHFMECAERIQSTQRPSCSKCDIIFGNPEDLNDHMNQAHSEQKAVVAEVVVASSQSGETAAETIPEDQTVPQTGTSTENSLSNNVSRKTTLKIRKRSNRSMQPYRCKICGERFSQLYGLKRHFRIHGKASQVSCPLCGITFKPETSASTSDGRIFKCPLRKCCDRVFDSLSAIRAHHFLKCSENPKVKEKIRIVKNVLTCDHCSQSFVSTVQLKEHSCTDPSELNSGLNAELLDRTGGTAESPLKEFQCSTCNKRFITEARRDEHMKLHQNNSKAYVCKICKHRFTLSKNLRRHVVQVHRSNAQYMCHHCGEDFQVAQGDNKSFRCHLYDCDQTFATLADLRSHHFLKCPENPELKEVSTAAYSCDKCARIFSTEGCLKAHISNVHEKPNKADSISGNPNSVSKSIKCPVCPKTFVTEAGLNQHVKIHPNAKPFTCRFCPAEFTRLKSLRRHFTSSHAQLSQSACEFCGEDFNNQSQKDESGQFRCNSQGCSLVFDTVAQLRSHHLQKCPLKADKGLEDGYTCDRCGKSFLGSTALKDHIASIHEKTFKFYCELCGRGFQKVCELKRHSQFVHSTEKRFECDVCKMRFKRSNQLFYHRRMHTGERPYICEICGKSFHIPGKLRLHVALHSGKKEFPCPICGKLFASKNYVTYHINFTHKGRSRSKKKLPTEVILEVTTTNPPMIETVIEFQPIAELEVHTEPLPTFEHITVETDVISSDDPM